MKIIDADDVMERIKRAYEDMGVDTHGIWNKQLAEIFKAEETDVEDIRLCLHKILGAVAQAPTVDIPYSDDWEKYSDKLWKNAYERGKAGRPQEWIPCSERLPKIGEKVLVSTKKTVFTQVYKGIYSDPKRWAWENKSVKRIEAWQPLPKPWKGVDDE